MPNSPCRFTDKNTSVSFYGRGFENIRKIEKAQEVLLGSSSEFLGSSSEFLGSSRKGFRKFWGSSWKIFRGVLEKPLESF